MVASYRKNRPDVKHENERIGLDWTEWNGIFIQDLFIASNSDISSTSSIIQPVRSEANGAQPCPAPLCEIGGG